MAFPGSSSAPVQASNVGSPPTHPGVLTGRGGARRQNSMWRPPQGRRTGESAVHLPISRGKPASSDGPDPDHHRVPSSRRGMHHRTSSPPRLLHRKSWLQPGNDPFGTHRLLEARFEFSDTTGSLVARLGRPIRPNARTRSRAARSGLQLPADPRVSPARRRARPQAPQRGRRPGSCSPGGR